MILTGMRQIKFKAVCDECGGLGIRIAHPESAPEATPIEYARCGTPRGDAGVASRISAKRNKPLYEF